MHGAVCTGRTCPLPKEQKAVKICLSSSEGGGTRGGKEVKYVGAEPPHALNETPNITSTGHTSVSARGAQLTFLLDAHFEAQLLARTAARQRLAVPVSSNKASSARSSTRTGT